MEEEHILKSIGEVIIDEDPFINEEGRSPRNLDIAAGVSGAIGVISLVAGLNGNVKSLFYISASNIDNGADVLLARAARKENNRESNHRWRRAASIVILAAQLSVIGASVDGLATHEYPKIKDEYVALAASGVAANAYILKILSKHAQAGTTHRDGYRHAFIDTAGNAAAGLAIVAANHGLPSADALAGVIIPAATIAATWLTKERMHAADDYFTKSSNSNNAQSNSSS